MEDSINETAPEPEKKKPLKHFTFIRSIQKEEEKTKEPKENNLILEKDNIKNKINLTFNISLYEEEIVFNVEQRKENFKIANIIYEKNLSSENFKGYKILSSLDLTNIFDIIQSSFEQNFDHLSLEEDKLKIKLIINLMKVLTEEINIELPMIKMTNQDEVLSLKESVKFLEMERNTQKVEINNLMKTIEEIQKKENSKDNIISELKNIIEKNKIEFQKKLEEKENMLLDKIEEKNNFLQNKINEKETTLLNKIEEKDNLHNDKIKEIQKIRDEKENEIITSVQKHQEEINSLIETQKYVKEKLICEEKETEKEKDRHCYKRVLNPKRLYNKFNLEINMILYEQKIKFIIKEIEDDLKTNPITYNTNFNYEDLTKKTVHFKSLENIESIYKFLNELFDDGKDSIKKENKKVIIKFNFPLGKKTEEIFFDIIEKKINLETTLINFSESLKEINKDSIITKDDFKKKLLEKVYPIGSYYWSSSNISPSDIFGGSWSKIRGRFLFASDSNHDVGVMGGEETVTLKISEMPRHDHQYDCFYFDKIYYGETPSSGYAFPVQERTSDYDKKENGSKKNGQHILEKEMHIIICLLI